MKKCIICLIMLICFSASFAAKPIKKVGIALYINDITQIRPKVELIDLDTTVYLQWQTDKKPKTVQYYYGKDVDKILGSIWWPYFNILKTRGESIATLQSLSIDKNGVAKLTSKLNLSIETPLNVHQFPFDKQELHIAIAPFGATPYKINYYLLANKSGVSPLAHLDEWKMTKIKNKISAHNGTQYKMIIYYQRHAGYYIYKIFLPLLFIVLISYMVLWLSKQPAINRLSVIITSMLTIVAFQWSVSGDMPKVSYVTYFQALILFIFIIISSMAVTVVIGERASSKGKKQLMHWARVIYPILFFLGMGIISLLWLFME